MAVTDYNEVTRLAIQETREIMSGRGVQRSTANPLPSLAAMLTRRTAMLVIEYTVG